MLGTTNWVAISTSLGKIVPISASRLVLPSIVPRFLAAYPDISLEVIAEDGFVDVLAAGCDAGIRYDERLEQDMVAVPVTGKQRQLVVGAPSYLARQRAPKHPTDLTRHCCIGWRPSPRAEPYRWEFEDNGRELDVAVNPQITTMANMAATIDHISGGRLELGMGAAWFEIEHDQYGIPFPRIGVRMDMLDEACRILRSLWTQETTTFEGRHFQLAETINSPQPLRQPHPPIIVGGYGTKRTPRIAAHQPKSSKALVSFTPNA